MIEEFLETDVLCVGGGIAGLMAAIRASELGARVIVAEKANTLRSGAGATGNDHFRCYIPEVHGTDIKPIIDIVYQNQQTLGGRSENTIRAWMEKTFDIVKLWDSWGIPMKYNGKWEFAGHGYPGRPRIHLKYSGREQKPILTKQAQKRGVQIVNRVMINDLLTDKNGIIGAIGIDTREDRLITFRAKSVILATGLCDRMYPPPTPGWMFNMCNPPATTGDGRAMAYRAGAELFNLEFPQRWAGPKYFARCGKGSWVGVIRDPQAKPVGPFVTAPERVYGDYISDIHHSLFEDYEKSGKGPVYMDCRGISDEDLEYMVYWLEQEGNLALLNHLKQAGIDLKKNPVEFMTYEPVTGGGIKFNKKGETSLRGLYAAGDEYFSGISGASTFGWFAGESAAEYSKQIESPDIDSAAITGKAAEIKDKLSAILGREIGPAWQEPNLAIQQIMHDYAGPNKSETMLNAGLLNLKRLKDQTHKSILARDQHELIHCLEVFNLFEIGELIISAALMRQETRGKFVRLDFPFTNPMQNNKILVCRKEDGKAIIEWKNKE